MKNTDKPQIYAIILAAGLGSRLKDISGQRKQFIRYQNAPLWWQSAKKFHNSPHIKGIILVFPADEDVYSQACDEAMHLHHEQNLAVPFLFAKGGAMRNDSVYSALELVPSTCSHVIIHDSARPFFSNTLVHTLVTTLCEQNYSAVIPAIPVTDTIKLVHPVGYSSAEVCGKNILQAETSHTMCPAMSKISAEATAKSTAEDAVENGPEATLTANSSCHNNKGVGGESMVEKTLPRHRLRAVQTPQAFKVDELLMAHEFYLMNVPKHVEITDDAMLMEYMGHKVYTVQGEENNIKITHAKDLALLQKTKTVPCSGYGYDVHRFGGNRPFVLGGIKIPTTLQIEAHSDGDVLLHALMDALLACMCLGDIGTLFPDSDKKFENISSSLLLDTVMEHWNATKLSLCHVDLTVITQKPKIQAHAQEIRKNIAKLLSISIDCVNVKATTEEKLGFTGEGLGIKAVALVSALKTVEIS